MRCLSQSKFRTLPVGGEGQGRRRDDTLSPLENRSKKDSDPIDLIRFALAQSVERRRLLQQQRHLQAILNDIPARRLLWEQACLPEGQAAKALIVDVMKCSRLIWRGGLVSAQVYEEALAKTWVWFLDKLPNYEPEKASFTTWFNNKLKWMILEEGRQVLPPLNKTELYGLIAHEPYAWENLLDEWVNLVRRDQQLMGCRMQGNLRLSCQVLLLEILAALQEVGEFSWEAISRREGLAIAQHQAIDQTVDPAVLKRFCRRRCFARFKELTSE